MRSTKSARRSWRGETLTEICGLRPRAAHSTCWAQAAAITQSPIDSIRPVSSATEMNSLGATSSPRSRSCQRSSASAPTSSPPRAKIGW